MHPDHRVGGDQRGGRAAARARHARAALWGCGRAGRPSRAIVVPGTLRGPVPPRRAARPLLHGRDARDCSHLDAARRAVPRCVRRDPGRTPGAGAPGLVFAHVSHAYPDGASLYFTLLAAQRLGHELEQWRAVKRAASEAIVRTGGTITHHHAIGRDHLPYIRDEIGELGVEAIAAVKARLDPAGIMNPGSSCPNRRYRRPRAARRECSREARCRPCRGRRGAVPGRPSAPRAAAFEADSRRGR